MRLRLPQKTSTQTLFAGGLATLHAIGVFAASGLALGWGAGAYVATTWALTMLPGIVITIVVGKARRHWWRWALAWLLLVITFPEVSLPVMVVGHTWASVMVLKEPEAG